MSDNVKATFVGTAVIGLAMVVSAWIVTNGIKDMGRSTANFMREEQSRVAQVLRTEKDDLKTMIRKERDDAKDAIWDRKDTLRDVAHAALEAEKKR